MADITTGIRIKADDREVKKLAASVKQAFTVKELRQFNVATRDLERQLGRLTKQQTDLGKALKGVEKGTDAYKKLREQLKGIREETKLVSTAMTQLDRIQTRAQRTAEMQAQRARQGGLRNFGAGIAQGAGVAQYIPSGPGMGARIAGAGIAGGIRRGAGIAAAPFMSPGIGGLTAAAGAIPGIGGFLAGGIQSAAASRQAAIQFDRTRLQNLYFRSFGAPGRAARTAFEKENAEIMAAADQKVAKLVTKQPPITKPLVSVSRWTGRAEVDEAQAGRLTQTAKEVARIRGAARGRVGRRRALDPFSPQFGVEFGLGPQQAQQALGQFMQARGGVTEVGMDSARQAREALAAQVQFGVSGQQAGAFARMGQPGGGGAGTAGLAQVLQSAVTAGLSGSRIPEYLQTMVALGQEAEKRGVKFDEQAFTRVTLRLRAGGLAAPRAAAVAAGANRAAMDLSARGVQSPMDVLMLRAAGFDPSQGPESYAAAVNKLAGGMDPETLNNLMEMIRSGASGFKGPQMQALQMRRAMSKAGMQIGPEEALDVLQGRVSATELIQRAERPGAGGRLVVGARRDVGRGAPGALAGAGLEALQIRAGQAAVWVDKFNKAGIDVGLAMKGFGKDLSILAGLVSQAAKKFGAVTEGGIAGLLAPKKEGPVSVSRVTGMPSIDWEKVPWEKMAAEFAVKFADKLVPILKAAGFGGLFSGNP